jgi:hypothetical protein
MTAAETPGTYKYLEVTDSDLSLLLAALEQVSDQNNCHAQVLLDRITHSLSSSPSSHHSSLSHSNHYGQADRDFACTNRTTRGEY